MHRDIEKVAAKMRSAAEEITRILGDVAADLSTVAHTVGNDVEAQQAEIERLNLLLGRERTARETEQRNKERFRYALWVYLQERDGLAGDKAPTPETLALIRDLIKELE